MQSIFGTSKEEPAKREDSFDPEGDDAELAAVMAATGNLGGSLVTPSAKVQTDDLTREVASLKTQLRDMTSVHEERVQFFQRQLEAKEAKISAMQRDAAESSHELKNELVACQESKSSLQALLDTKAQALESCQTEIAKLNAARQAEEEHKKDVDTSAAAASNVLQSKLDQCERELMEKDLALQAAQRQLETSTQEVEHLKGLNDDANTKHQQALEEFKNLYKEQSAGSTEVYQSQLDTLQKEFDTFKKQSQEVVVRNEQDLAAREEMLAALQKALEEKDNKLKTETQTKEQLVQAIAANDNHLKTQQADYEEKLASQTKLIQELASKQEADMNAILNQTATGAAEKDAMIKSLREDLQAATQRGDSAQQTREEIEAAFKQCQQSLDEAKNKVAAGQQELADVKSQLAMSQSSFEAQNEKFRTLQAEMASLGEAQGRTEQLEAEIRMLREQESQQQDDMRRLAAESAVRAEKMDAQITHLEASAIAAKQKELQLCSELENCRSAMMAQQIAGVAPPAQQPTTSASEAQLQAEITQLRSELSKSNQELMQCSAAVAELSMTKEMLAESEKKRSTAESEATLLRGMSPAERQRQQEQLTTIREQATKTNTTGGQAPTAANLPSSATRIIDDDAASVMSTVSQLPLGGESIVVRLTRAPGCPYAELKTSKFSVKQSTTVEGMETFIRKRLGLKDHQSLRLGVNSEDPTGTQTNSIAELAERFAHVQKVLPLMYCD
eukprot:TRINITY_DN94618_c0_g1_i1.p1 TRINITY_DN94618_c0_g1~~TRINITY_DN94618_c0_g1_i1.p1  ORF type:complete len:732 (-),score=174.27 TRINITY_DN94618_c0_g1_i1:691-2886(-)